MTTPTHAPSARARDAVEGFLALLAARRAPRTVDAYRGDLAALTTFLGKPPAEATTEELERYIAQLRADGLAPATIARRTAAARALSKSGGSCANHRRSAFALVTEAAIGCLISCASAAASSPSMFTRVMCASLASN